MSDETEIKLLAQAIEMNGYCLLHDACTMQGGGESSYLDAKLRRLDAWQVMQLEHDLNHRFGHHVRGTGFMPKVEIGKDEHGQISSFTFRPSLLDTKANSSMVVRGLADEPEELQK